MNRRSVSQEQGFTLIQLIIAAVILAIVGYGAFTLLYSEAARSGPSEGIFGGFARESGFALDHTGPVTAIAAVNGNDTGTAIQFPRENATKLGAIQMNVALFMGDSGSINFDRVSLYWVYGSVVEKIPRKTAPPLVCPGWMITGKYGAQQPSPAGTGTLPVTVPPGMGPAGRTSDTAAAGGDILRPGQQFGILVCPTNTTPPYQQFSLLANPPGVSEPPVAIITAPPMDHPLMTLGSE